MIAVDTNVVSELMKVVPDQDVIVWANSLTVADLAVPAVVLAELLHGLGRLPAGDRRARLDRMLDAFLSRLDDDRVLALDGRGAVEYANLMTRRDETGKPMNRMDALIAATCRAHGASLATRNTKDFVGCSIELIDPWTTVHGRA